MAVLLRSTRKTDSLLAAIAAVFLLRLTPPAAAFALLIVLSAVLTALTAAALGGLLVRLLRLPLLRQERAVVAFIIGAACLSLIVFTLCATHLYYRGTIVAVGVIAVVAAWRAGAYRSPESFAKLDKFKKSP